MNTKIKIANTLEFLLQSKELDRISVKELVEACGVSRQTFYYHFQDILDVIEWSAQYKLDQALLRVKNFSSAEESIREILCISEENKVLIRRLMCSRKREYVESCIVDIFRAYIRELLSLNTLRLDLGFSDRELLLDFLAYGLAGVVLNHCSDENSDGEDLAARLCRLHLRLREGSIK